MHGAEGIGDVNFRHGGHGLGQLGIVLGLALFKAGVLQQQDLTGLEGGGLGLGIGAHHVLGHDDGSAQQLTEALGHGSQGQLLQGLLPGLLRSLLALFRLLLGVGLKGGGGLAQVRAGDHGSVLVQQVLDGGQSRADALVVGDDAAAVLGQGHVEVTAQQDLLALDVYVPDSFFVVVHRNASDS